MTTETNPANPLAGFFRLPGLEISLPTNGRYMPAGSIELNPAGKVEVFAMQGSDELLLTSPDALMSGVAVEKIIESCIPAIKNPELVSAPDLDVIVIAIRAASSGNTMEMELTCPKCKEEMEFEVDLRHILATTSEIPETLELRLSDEMVIFFKPHSLRDQTRMMLAAFEENRRVTALEGKELDDATRRQVLIDTLGRMKNFENESIMASIEKIVVPNAEVTERAFIMEWLANAPKKNTEAIKKKLEEINGMGIDKTIDAKCMSEKCGHEWKTSLEFNPSTFFAQGS